jgi:DNA-binding NarL/FixJ family response regulator
VISSTLEDDPVGGISVLRHARAEHPPSRAIVLLEKDDKDLIVEAFRAGAKGVFIRSDFSFANLCKCVHSVHQGEIWAESQHLVYVLDTFASEDSPQRRSRSDGSSSLSKREREVMRLVVDGLSNREIATALGLSEHTIKNYVFRLFEKLGVYSRVELVHYALARHEPSSATLLAATQPKQPKQPKQTKMREAAAMSIVR